MRIDSCLQTGLNAAATSVAFLLAAILSGCQLLQDFETERRIRLAEQEHAACVERGYDFPGTAYTECRMDLHDQRLRQRWMELQMSANQQSTISPTELPRRNVEPYRPLRIEDYRCEMRRDEQAQGWIHCFETAAGR